MSKKERERGTEKGRESIELGYEVEKGGMILLENVRETNENEQREDRRRKGQKRREKEGGERERDIYDVPYPGKNSETDVADEGLQRDRGNWSQTQYDN